MFPDSSAARCLDNNVRVSREEFHSRDVSEYLVNHVGRWSARCRRSSVVMFPDNNVTLSLDNSVKVFLDNNAGTGSIDDSLNIRCHAGQAYFCHQ